jgi:hypothetical protein
MVSLDVVLIAFFKDLAQCKELVLMMLNDRIGVG